MALQRGTEDDLVTLSEQARTAMAYARAISSTPPLFDEGLIEARRHRFTEREIVILATTAAQVNYWARTIQALDIHPAGFCTLPDAHR